MGFSRGGGHIEKHQKNVAHKKLFYPYQRFDWVENLKETLCF